ncbi:MAG TPA: hypothetical protein VMJ11_13025 [Paraburkholderia sp.]|uniref:hypothetical protein n=1 Tax=Paraburkholderia sp. TaxID=1926495 RepID=UPI002C2C733E|nr:hypothetical protein [Paraburkholderia sp.]HTR07543.1 hypothetical protein [Paraburkholderia sp.]
MNRTMTMTLRTMAPGKPAAMARTQHAQGMLLMRRAVGFAIVASGFAAIAAQGLAHLTGH